MQRWLKQVRQRVRSIHRWGKLRQLRRMLGVWGLVLLFGLSLTVAVGATERSSGGRVEVAQAARQVEPFSVNGRLDEKSQRMESDGSYFNVHSFEGIAGATIAIDLVSEEFDAYLILLDPQGNKVTENDDSDGTNAQITIELPATGTYTILANTLNAGEIGRYTLSLQAVTATDLALAEADRLTQQVGQLYEQGKYAEAIPLAEQALQIREQLLGTNHLDVATSLNNLASLYQDQGRYSQAELLYQRALVIREQQLDKDHPDVAQSLNNLALLYQDQGRYSEAEPLLQRALAIREQQLGKDHPDVAQSLNSLALLYQVQGRYSEAEPLLQRALTISEQQLGKDHPNVAASLNNLALLYQDQGRYSEAEPLHQRALAISEQRSGKDHPNVAASLNNLASLYQDQGRYSEAEPLYQRALAIYEQRLGRDHPDVATSLNNLAELYRDQGRYSQAEPLYKRALTIYEQQLGRDHPDVATSLNNLALFYQAQGRYSQAEPLHQRALAIREQQLGKDHPDVAQSLNNLALLYQDQGRYSQAEPLLQRALTIYEQQLGKDHPNVAKNLSHLAVLYWAENKIASAIDFFNRGMQIEETNLALNLAIGSETRKQDYIATISGTTAATLSLHLQAAPANIEAAKLALTTTLRRKGRVLDATADNFRLLRQNLKPEDQQLFDELNRVLSQQSTLSYSGLASRSPDEYRTQMNALNTQAENLQNTLAQRSTAFRNELQPVTIEGIQQFIPNNTALLELIQYRPLDPTAPEAERWGSARYAAYILHTNGDPKWVDLGEAAAIDPLVEQFRTALSSRSSTVQTIARQLDAKLMQPIRPLLGNSDQILISPDSQLNLIPFAALVDEQNRYLLETFTFTYLTSGRDLLRLQTDTPSRQAPVLIANPDYDTPGDATQLATQPISQPGTSVASQPSQRSANLRSSDLASLQFGPLAGTQREIDAIRPLLPNATVLTARQASETSLKQLQAPNILHIATHGFFLQDTECFAVPDSRGDGSIGIRPLPSSQLSCRPTPSNSENPLLRSGLALAGFNPRQGGGDEDGVLTAVEAAGLNLYGTKLVVMSACETGLGAVANGEGVYGLRRAFVIAGTESQLMSLWKVDDAATAELMSLYYQRLQQQQGRSTALRQIQQAFLQAPSYQHPYYWAGFIFSGDASAIEGL